MAIEGDGDRVVELARFPSQFEADALAAVLDSHGIRTSVLGDGAGGWLPQVTMVTGVRVLVLERDLGEAQEILDAAEALPTTSGDEG